MKNSVRCSARATTVRFALRISSPFEGEETAVESILPLQVAELKPGDRLLIVTCNYQLADKTKSNGDLEDCLVLAADSVGFHLIAAL